MQNLNVNKDGREMKNALRVLATKALAVFMTLILVMGTSPLMQVAYAEEQNAAETLELNVAPQNEDAQDSGEADEGAGDAATTDSQDATADTGDAQSAQNTEDADAEEEAEAEAEAQASDEDAIAPASAEGEDGIEPLSDEQSDKPVSGKKYGSITYTQNTEKNAFLSSAYDKYRDGGTSLGIANSFHIVAFDTLSAGVDIYGNLLVKNLTRIVDNGTSDKFVDIYQHNTLSYIQNYTGTWPRWDKSANGCVVFGSGVNITTRNNSELLLNGARIENPNSVVQDADSATAPFIDIDALQSNMSSLSATLAARAEVGATSELVNDGKVRNITINEGYTGCAYVSLTAAELTSSYERINIDGLSTKSGSGLVINVDCQGASSIDVPKTYLRINGKDVGIGEVDSVYGDTGYVLYNFYNTAENLPITVHECTASVLAPNASLTLGPGSACGTFIGNNVTVMAESHTRPFHGNLTPSDDDDDDDEDFALSGYSMRAADAPVSDADKICYVDPKVVKVLDGRALKDGEFSFQLIDESGKVISTATNDAAGMVDFDRANPVEGSDPDNPSCLSFSAAGTYTYTVRETPGQVKDPTVVYSTEVVQFVTTIGEDEDGSLYEAESHYVKYANAEDAAAQKNGTIYAATEHPTITNAVKPLSLAVTKTDAATGAGLSGAVYALYRVDASAAGGAVQVMTATSDADGLMVFTGADASAVAEGEQYYFQEIAAPAGYTVQSNKTETFTIERATDGTYSLKYADGTVSKSSYAGTATDPIVFKAGEGVTDAQTSVTFGKVSSDGTALSGAKLAIRDAAGKDVDAWTTGTAGHVVMGLSVGVEYTLYEQEAPQGYAKAAQVVFTLDEYGNVTIVSGATANSVMNAYVTGSTLTLIDYKRTEIEQKREVIREEGTPAKKTTASKKGSLPQTGDSSIVMIAAAVTVALFSIGAGLVQRRRNKK